MLDVRLKMSNIYKFILLFLFMVSIIYLYKSSFIKIKVTDKLEAQEKESVRVDVYYECLCPDSRHFVVHQLFPAWSLLKEIMEVNLIPYGKASSKKSGDLYEFQCQHGPVECTGNTYHACVAKTSKPEISLLYVKCMIENNLNPSSIAEKCAGELAVPFSEIDTCAKGREGNMLSFMMGELTHSLRASIKSG
ncbi:gamma-interferon-inducible lysosomal thiol reductase isoform X2 [Eurytemora carolleeae]|uniref:gamma-interferon-inducible lysosomal thiol reductase isoform X2 n=1 Tax=Eurytemora carolleeae TaxID=1294199 RepID=UPI000C7661CB|nr:gamma-interferon-inducible lysosomal thiol reductase isoform X2 [Eurytemora carolleeae]|eukprot:XP_023329243.1 gamma-interferon-inducible lysosomal thiol reductase-like isoform X2 [Eurytemora affinis]